MARLHSGNAPPCSALQPWRQLPGPAVVQYWCARPAPPLPADCRLLPAACRLPRLHPALSPRSHACGEVCQLCLRLCCAAAPSTCLMDVEYEIANPLTLSVRACTCPGCHLDFGPTACCPAAGLAVPACMRSCAAARGARGMRACGAMVSMPACIYAGLPGGGVCYLAQRLRGWQGAAPRAAERGGLRRHSITSPT